MIAFIDFKIHPNVIVIHISERARLFLRVEMEIRTIYSPLLGVEEMVLTGRTNRREVRRIRI